jgi:hypothetical protein
VAAPDPDQVHTPGQFAAALNALRGELSYKALTRAHPGLRRSTLSDLLTGRSAPTAETLRAYLAACGLDPEAQRAWLSARRRVGAALASRPAGAVRARAAAGRRLGVHPSIQVTPSAAGLPAYVGRDFDLDLRAALRPGAFVLLRGGSSTGKTRSLFEAVREALPDWWLLPPPFPDQPLPRTVLWMDEFQRHPVPPSSLRSMLAGGAIVVGTLWPDEYNCRFARRGPGQPDPYAESLAMAHVLDVPEAFTPEELRRATVLAGEDRRLRVAPDTAADRITQVLAAGPELIRWWANADTTDPRQGIGQAVITAALDARRAGAGKPLTPAFLAAAAPAYLTAAQRARAPVDWLEQALDYATTRLHGAAACLTPVGAEMGVTAGYRTADYLHQHARRSRRAEPLPLPVWRALVEHHPGDTADLADSAKRRGRPEIERLLLDRMPRLERIQHHLSGECHRILVNAVLRDGALTGPATELPIPTTCDELRERVDAGHPGAARLLIETLTARGDIDALRAETHAGTPLAADRLAALGQSP